jgi:hypothetical protein
VLDETRARDWSAFDGLPLVEVVDRLYAEWVEREIVRTGNLDDPGMAAVIRHRSGNQWWSTYYDSRTLGQAYNLPKIVEGNCVYFRDRLRMLKDCVTPLLAALCSGKVQIEANQDHENNYRVVRVPSRLWKDGNWILYRNSVPELITVRFVTGSRAEPSLQGIEKFFTPRLSVFGSASTPPAPPADDSTALKVKLPTGLEGAVSPVPAEPGPSASEAPQADDPAASKTNPPMVLEDAASPVSVEPGPREKRSDPRNKRDQMLRGLELALSKQTIRPGMTQVELHRAMLDALEILRNAIPRGFAYDAFRKHCRSWIIERNFMR